MAQIGKSRINPYLFLLLKKMLDYEFVGIGKEPTNLRLAHYLYDRHKSPAKGGTKYSDSRTKRDSNAYAKAHRIKKFLLDEKNFQFTPMMLNYVLDEISILGTYQSWEDFCQQFSAELGVITVGRKYMKRDFSELTLEEQDTIRVHAQNTINRLHFKRKLLDPEYKHKVLAYSDHFYVIRTANPDEICDIVELARRVYPCRVLGIEIKQKWLKKNPYIFFIIKDVFDAWATISLIPITPEAYEALKSGEMYEDEISHHDIYSYDEIDKVRYVYIEGFVCTSRWALPLVAEQFSKMIMTLADATKHEIVLCAMGGSEEGIAAMKRRNFKQSGWMIDRKENKQYPFFEIDYKDSEKELFKLMPDNYSLVKLDTFLTDCSSEIVPLKRYVRYWKD